MARNTGRGSRIGSGKYIPPTPSIWTKRSSTTGKFTEAKKSGGMFKGIRREPPTLLERIIRWLKNG